VLKVINSKPLEYASYGGIDPKKVKGEGRINLKMNFPLMNDLKFKDVKLTASGKFQKVSLERQITKTLNAELMQGDLSFNLTQDKMEIKGKGVLNKLPSTLLYTHYFKNQNPNEIEIQVDTKASFDDFKRLGFDYTKYAQGPTNTKLTYQRTTEGQNKVAIDLDTTATDLIFQSLDWEKKPGEKSHISFILFMENEKLSKINPIRFASPTYSFLGEALFDNNGEWKQIHLSDFKGPFTDTQVTIQKLNQNAYEIGFKGRSVNLENILKLLDDDTKKQEHPPTHLKLSADVGALRLGEDRIFNKINGFANLFIVGNDTYWKEVHFTAQAGQGTANRGQMSQVSGGISFDLHAPQGDTQTLEVRANDAGTFLKNLDIYQGIKGGYITIKAKRKNQGPFSGSFKMKNFDALEAPLLAQFAALLSPMGIANLLSGTHTLSMESFGCSFEFGEEFVKIQKGIGKSMSLGFTVDGKLDRKKRLFSLKGNVIPARFLNSILSNIPVIGSLLNGGEGQGMFAISYTVTGSFDNPEISLNPLTAFAPGFIRNLFTFSDEE
ncbi:MAG: AsmA-like C-terminal domain-containing protein, partial [Alphaproteobacteria bacterium]|nr:AsmA-like C-terminal domain-containing protein [Alphaproteobacteria bacterium]